MAITERYVASDAPTYEVITLDVSPVTDWAADDVVTGQTSAKTCTVVLKLSATTYIVKSRNGAYTVGEIVGVTGNANKLADQGAANPTFANVDGSSATYPWTLSQAFASYAAGDRVNIKSGTYTRAADDTLTVDGTVTAPVIFRGYNTTIGDLEPATLTTWRTSDNGPLVTTNFPVIAYNSTKILNAGGADGTIWQNLKITGTRAGILALFGVRCATVQCDITNSSADAAAYAVNVNTRSSLLACDIACSGASTNAAAIRVPSNESHIIACRIQSSNKGVYFSTGGYSRSIINNVFVDCADNAIDCTTEAIYSILILGNTSYSSGDTAIMLPNDADNCPVVIDNHITDSTGYAIDSAYAATANVPIAAFFNRFRDNSSGVSNGFGDWAVAAACTVGNIVATDGAEDATTDYQDAASGDLELKITAPGAKKSSMPYRDIGAVQHADPAGGGGGIWMPRARQVGV